MFNFLMIFLSAFGLFSVASVDTDIEKRNSLRVVSQDYQNGYNDGYNAAMNQSIFAPSNIDIVYTLPYYDVFNSLETAYYVVESSYYENWHSANLYDFMSSTFEEEWLLFYEDTMSPAFDIGNESNLTMIINFKNPVSFKNLNFSGRGFSAFAFEYYNSNSSLVWNYAQGERNDYYFSLTIPESDADYSAILVQAIWLQLPVVFNSYTDMTFLSNSLVLVDDNQTEYNKGFDAGKNAGYNNGFSAGEISGYENGYNDAEEYYTDKYNKLMDDYLRLNENYNDLFNETWTLPKLFWSIGSVPFETFKSIWNVEFLGVNIASFITRISSW